MCVYERERERERERDRQTDRQTDRDRDREREREREKDSDRDMKKSRERTENQLRCLIKYLWKETHTKCITFSWRKSADRVTMWQRLNPDLHVL